ncbi:hypothetical protein [Acinetobacter sp. HY1485]|uniref:hypothetical protein n=1 Tax=Acinetobacter sp. HY1485 TaxID=2970918 RepID=UPI0022B94E12|nr:hypothetical protein [Acinetobacter sp. HY1485]
MSYTKTAEGITALQQRNKILSVKQRQLLILIDTPDFKRLNDQARQKVCSSQLLNELVELGFIQDKTKPTQPPHPISPKQPQVSIVFDEDGFDGIKKLMIETLEQYCGLLAQSHIRQLERTTTSQQLHQCHRIWITLLQESRIPTTYLQSLNQHIQQFYLKYI